MMNFICKYNEYHQEPANFGIENISFLFFKYSI